MSSSSRPSGCWACAGPADHYVFRTQPEGARSGPGDTDLVVYSLRKYLRLATKGNPTALLPLYAPPESVLILTPLGEELRALTPALLSQHAIHRFLGYLEAQRSRLVGDGPRRGTPNRPELVERYGYDVKYASHALRLAYQGLEVGRARPAEPAHARTAAACGCSRVKRGEVPDLAEVLAEIGQVQAAVEERLATGRTPLPPEAGPRGHHRVVGARAPHPLGLVLTSQRKVAADGRSGRSQRKKLSAGCARLAK